MCVCVCGGGGGGGGGGDVRNGGVVVSFKIYVCNCKHLELLHLCSVMDGCA